MRPASVIVATFAIAGLAHAATTPPAEPAPVPTVVAPGLWWIPGGIRAGHQPDGNSVVLAARDGLVVVDTGRHAWHREAILALAQERHRPIVAVVNSHWHLDHVSGNPALRAAYPGLKVYASRAIDGALAGFLAKSERESAGYLADESIPATMRDDIRADAETIRNGAALEPDVPITSSATMSLGGRKVQVHLAANAATAGDVWLYDPATQVAIVGDLVTLPAPFLDTACPDGWQRALGEVAASKFEKVIPGHGAPMNRAQFESYRAAFAGFVACAASTSAKEACSAQWAEAVQPLLDTEAKERQRAEAYAAYYVDLLRANGGRSEYCSSGKAAG